MLDRSRQRLTASTFGEVTAIGHGHVVENNRGRPMLGPWPNFLACTLLSWFSLLVLTIAPTLTTRHVHELCILAERGSPRDDLIRSESRRRDARASLQGPGERLLHRRRSVGARRRFGDQAFLRQGLARNQRRALSDLLCQAAGSAARRRQPEGGAAGPVGPRRAVRDPGDGPLDASERAGRTSQESGPDARQAARRDKHARRHLRHL